MNERRVQERRLGTIRSLLRNAERFDRAGLVLAAARARLLAERVKAGAS